MFKSSCSVFFIPSFSATYEFISSLGTDCPSAFIISFINVTSIHFPPFVSIAIYLAICNGVKLFSACPIPADSEFP